jgi:hypothetical protein
MIAYIRGLLAEKEPSRVVVEAAGVGYELLIPLSTYDRLPREGAEVKLLAYHSVREDDETLYGFATKAERELFSKLTAVSGVGPKIALAIISGGGVGEIALAITSGNAKRLASMEGGVNGVLVKSDFAFGPFKGYIAEGKMPADSQLAELQRRWDDVATITEILAAAGITELVDVQYKANEEAKEEESKPKKGARRGKERRGVAAKEVEVAKPAAFSYVFTFTSRPAGIVKALNALRTGERFTVVEDFSFVRERDVIAEALGGDEKKDAASGGRRGRRGRRQAAEEVKNEEEPKNNGIITDPLLDSPCKVQMALTVYDFRSLEEVKGEEVKK